MNILSGGHRQQQGRASRPACTTRTLRRRRAPLSLPRPAPAPLATLQYCYICSAAYLGGLHFESWNIFGCPGKQFSSDMPLSPCHARCKRWTSNFGALLIFLVMLSVGLSALANPLFCIFACCFMCCNICKNGRCCSWDD